MAVTRRSSISCTADSATGKARRTLCRALIPLDFRQGDFSRLGSNLIYDPSTNRSTPTGIVRDPFPGNRIPQERFSAISRNILPLLPTPNNSGIFNNFLSVGRGQTSSNQVNVKIDHAFTDRNRISGYVYRDINRILDPELVPGPTSPNRKSGSRNAWARISHDFVLSPTKLNHLNVGYTRFVTQHRELFPQPELAHQAGAHRREHRARQRLPVY